MSLCIPAATDATVIYRVWRGAHGVIYLLGCLTPPPALHCLALRASQRSAAKVTGGKGNFREIRKPLGELGFLFISTTFSDRDKQELSSAVEELRHQRSRGRSLTDVTGTEANPLLGVIAFFSQWIGPRRCHGSQRVVLCCSAHLHEGKARALL